MPKQPQVLAPGEGISGVDVGIRKKPRGLLAATTTGANGKFLFRMPPSGKYGMVIAAAEAAKHFNEAHSNIWRAIIVLERAWKGGKTAPIIIDFELTNGGNLIKIVPSGTPPVPDDEQNEITFDVDEGQSVSGSIAYQGTRHTG